MADERYEIQTFGFFQGRQHREWHSYARGNDLDTMRSIAVGKDAAGTPVRLIDNEALSTDGGLRVSVTLFSNEHGKDLWP